MSSIKQTITITANPVTVQVPETSNVVVDVSTKEYDIFVTGYGRISNTNFGGNFDTVRYHTTIESFGFVELFAITFNKELSDSANTNENIIFLYNKAIEDIPVLAEIISFNINTALSDTAVLLENIALTTDTTKTDILFVSEKVTLFVDFNLIEQTTPEDVLLLSVNKEFSETYSLSEEFIIVSDFKRNFIETVFSSDLLSFSLYKNIFETATVVENIDLQRYLEAVDSLIETTSTAEELYFSFETSLEDTFIFAEDIFYFDSSFYLEEDITTEEALSASLHDYSLEDYFETKFDYVSSQLI